MIFRIITIIILLVLSSPAWAENYYCVKTGGTKTTGVSTTDIDAFGWGASDCYGTVGGAIGQMTSGSQVWVDDGTYTGVANAIDDMPSGTAGDYTIIKARNVYGATIDSGLNSDAAWDYNKRLVKIYGTYIQVDGFKLRQRDSSNNYANQVTGYYVKMTRCLLRIENAMNGEMWGVAVTGGSHDVLIEDVAACGAFRYMFGVVGISTAVYNVVFRRCIGRGDWSTTSEPYSIFALYGGNSETVAKSHDIYFQNCIVLDTNLIQASNTYKHVPWYIFKANYTAMLDSCITLANYIPYYFFFRNDYNGYNLEIKNSVFAANTGSSTTASWRGSSVTSGYDRVHGCTFYGQPRAFSWNGTTSSGYIKNNLFVDLSSASISFSGTSPSSKIYNSFSSSGQQFGSNVVAYNGDMIYLPRVETISNRYSGGDGGANVGAHIVKKLGTSGTLYGDTGWNVETDDDLWPWTNEDDIRDWFMVANPPPAGASPSSNDTTRGFCASGQTLTNYIWGYLGNGGYPGGGGDTSAPVIYSLLPSGAQNCPSDSWPLATVSLALSTNESATCKYSTSDVSYDSMGNTFSTTGTTSHSQSLTVDCGGTYTYYVRCSDGSGNKNSSSSVASFFLGKDPRPSRDYHID